MPNNSSFFPPHDDALQAIVSEWEDIEIYEELLPMWAYSEEEWIDIVNNPSFDGQGYKRTIRCRKKLT